MTAAFDLLKPSVFHQNIPLEGGLMDIVMDFMSSRKMVVNLSGSTSNEKELNVGCVQGSILGPKLFGLYCSGLSRIFPANTTKLISYADDTYVICVANSHQELENITNACFSLHKRFLEDIGMIVNSAKTELLYSSRRKDFGKEKIEITTNTGTVVSQKTIKALGVQISDDLSWDAPVNFALNRSRPAIIKLKYIRRLLGVQDTLKLMTSQYHSILFYAAPVWLGSISSSSWTHLNSAHYNAVRIALHHYNNNTSRNQLHKLSQRATPKEWASYSTASMVIKLFNKSDTEISKLLRTSIYINDRAPGRGRFIDGSRLRIGKQQLQYRIGPVFHAISFDWIGDRSDDYIRKNLKKVFFKHSV